MTEDKDFKGYIHDVGGPTANFRHTSCEKQLTKGVCIGKQCLFPEPCKNLTVDHKDYVVLLRELRKIPKVKKVFIRSGIRFDYMCADKDDTFLKELCKNHISGQLRVAPEHISDSVLKLMGKPKNEVYERFRKKFEKVNLDEGKKQYIVPYLMSSHPGSTMKEAVELAEYVRDLGYMPEQVQDFYPTPSTISTCMYYTGLDPRTMEKVYVPVNPHEKAMQRALIQYRNPENYDLVKEALIIAGRTDLIGFGEECLIPPRKMAYTKYKNSDTKRTDNVRHDTSNSHVDNVKHNSGKNAKNHTAKDSNKHTKNVKDSNTRKNAKDSNATKYAKDSNATKYSTNKNNKDRKYSEDKSRNRTDNKDKNKTKRR